MPDKSGYPTTKELKYIKDYDYLKEKSSFIPLIEYIESIWWTPSFGFHYNRRRLTLHTGGWSGNEDIIDTLESTFFWIMCWKKSIRGGHYWFVLPTLKGYLKGYKKK